MVSVDQWLYVVDGVAGISAIGENYRRLFIFIPTFSQWVSTRHSLISLPSRWQQLTHHTSFSARCFDITLALHSLHATHPHLSHARDARLPQLSHPMFLVNGIFIDFKFAFGNYLESGTF